MKTKAREYFKDIAGFYPTHVEINSQEVLMKKAKFELRVSVKDL